MQGSSQVPGLTLELRQDRSFLTAGLAIDGNNQILLPKDFATGISALCNQLLDTLVA